MINRSMIFLSGGSTLAPFLCFTTDGQRVFTPSSADSEKMDFDAFYMFLLLFGILKKLKVKKIQVKFKNSVTSKMIISR